MGYTALLDANVLYPAPTRDLLLQLGVADICHVKWSADIHREWMSALLRDRPDLSVEMLERTRRLMDQATRDCLVTGYEPLIATLDLPDPDDRHVLAAAIVGRCDVIITHNLRDFPAVAIARYGVEAQHPDEYLTNHLNLAPGPFCAAVRKVRARLKNPPIMAPDYLAILASQGLVALAGELAAFDRLI